jgi:hypothetical protein
VNSAPGTDNTGSNAGFGQTLGLCEKVAPSNNPASGIWEKLGTSDMSDNLTVVFYGFFKDCFITVCWYRTSQAVYDLVQTII